MGSSTPSIRALAVAVAIGAGAIAVFQAALALGVPWGRAAWGGAQATLSPDLRLASGVAAIVWVLAVLVVLGRGGYWGTPRWVKVFRWGTWLAVALLVQGAIVNLASSSGWERFGWGPFALVTAILCFLLARGQTTTASRTDQSERIE